MEVHFRIEANEIENDEKLTYYNNICWRLKKPFMGFSHFVEHYDDVNDVPDCYFGVIESGEFVRKLSGELDRGIDNIYIGFGGVWYDVYINSPQDHFKLKEKE